MNSLEKILADGFKHIDDIFDSACNELESMRVYMPEEDRQKISLIYLGLYYWAVLLI